TTSADGVHVLVFFVEADDGIGCVLVTGVQTCALPIYAFSGGDDGWLPLFRATGGTIVHGALSDFSAAVNDVSQFYFQVDWASRVPSSGFVISRAALSDLQGHVLLAIPDVAASPSAPLPSI